MGNVEKEFTELTDAEFDRVDLVSEPANGTSFLMMKSGAPLMTKEAVEDLLKSAEPQEETPEAEPVQKSVEELVAEQVAKLKLEQEFWYAEPGADYPAAPEGVDVSKRSFSAQERREAARSGAALPDGSYPIENAGDLHNAVHLAGHGSKHSHAEIHDHIVSRAKALGMKNALPKSWGQGDGSADGGKTYKSAVDQEAITEMVKSAVAEVTKADKERIEALEAELTKVKQTPLPGGPVLMGAAPTTDATKKAESRAEFFRKQAELPGINAELKEAFLAAARKHEQAGS